MPERPALLRRLPRLRGPKPSGPILDEDARAEFDEFAPDFSFLDEALVPEFSAYDNAALAAQNRFRLEQLTVIVGGAATTVLGSLHAALGDEWNWIAFVEAGLAFVLGVVVLLSQRAQSQRRYLDNRLRAERLRAEFFRFVARAGAYSDDANRQQALRMRVAEVTGDET